MARFAAAWDALPRFAGASCASGYGGGVIAVLSTLVLLALAGAVLHRATRRVETAAVTLTGLRPAHWVEHADELCAATDVLRDAVDDRRRR